MGQGRAVLLPPWKYFLPVMSELPESIVRSDGERDEFVQSCGQIERNKQIHTEPWSSTHFQLLSCGNE